MAHVIAKSVQVHDGLGDHYDTHVAQSLHQDVLMTTAREVPPLPNRTGLGNREANTSTLLGRSNDKATQHAIIGTLAHPHTRIAQCRWTHLCRETLRLATGRLPCLRRTSNIAFVTLPTPVFRQGSSFSFTCFAAAITSITMVTSLREGLVNRHDNFTQTPKY